MKTTNPRILRVLNWLMEKAPGERFLIEGRSHVWLYDTVGTVGGKPVLDRIYPKDKEQDVETLRRFNGTLSVDLTTTQRAGLLTTVSVRGAFGDRTVTDRRKAFVERYAGHPMPVDHGNISYANDALVEWWKKEGRAHHAAMIAESEEVSRQVDRTILIACTAYMNHPVPDDLKALLPGDVVLPFLRVQRRIPYATARVTRETGKRLYVTDIVRLDLDLRLLDVRSSGVVMGQKPNEYIENASVYRDRVDAAIVARIQAAENEFAQDLHEIHSGMLAEVASTLTRFSDRVKQKRAERDEVVSQIETGRTDF